MEFHILGPLEVADGKRLVEVGGPRQRALLAMLLVHVNRVVSADRLVEVVWGERGPQRAAASLQVLISNLRRVLEPDRAARMAPRVLVTRPPGYLLVADEAQLDAAGFEGLLRNAQQLLAQGRAAEARAALDEALGLWRGPALAEFAAEDFARTQAARLEELQTVALEDRIRADLALGRHAAAVADAERLLGEHPFRERLWGLLMVGYYRAGRQADALRAFQQARRHLAEELGIAPSPALQRLEADLLAQAPSLDWEAPTSALPPAPAVPAETPAPSRTGLVGRASELRRLRAALDCAAAGQAAVLLVSGEPGVGKTRLVEELAHQAAENGAVVAWGRCHPGQSAPPFWPWTQVLRGIVTEVEAAAADHEVAAVAHLVPELKGAAPTVGPVSADPTHARFQLCQDVAEFLQRAAASRCLVVVLDDLHWADAASVELLAAVVSRLAGSRLLLVATHRDVEVSEALVDALATLVRAPTVERLRLAGMTEADCGRLIASAIDTEPSAQLVRAVHARTDGNPFFVTELLRLLREEGALTGAAAEAALRSAVPVGVHDVITQRLGRLSETSRHLLSIAAVAGREFDQRLLDMAGGASEEESLAAVELAVSYGLVRESAEVVGRYRFSHALIRETIYAGISRLRRARLHALLGELIEDLPDDGDANRVVDLAYHFAEAAPVRDADKAFQYAMTAADAAADQLAYERAEEHLRRAVQMAALLSPPERPPAELRALARLGALLAATLGQASPEVRTVFERARELCRRGDGSRDAVTALWGYFYSCYVRGDLDAARAVARDLLVPAGAGAAPEVVMGGHLAMGISSLHAGQLAEARDHLLATIEIADRLGDPSLAAVFQVDPRVYARSFLALVLALVGESQRAEETARGARRLAAEVRQPFTTATAAMFGAWLGFLRDDPASTTDHAAATLALADQHGFPLLAAAGRAFEGWALARGDELEAASVRVATGLAPFRLSGGRLRQPLFVALEVEVVHLAGRPERALAILDEALAVTPSTQGQHYFDAALYRLRAEIVANRFPDRAEEARENLRRAVAIARAQGAEGLRRRAEAELEGIGRLEVPREWPRRV